MAEAGAAHGGRDRLEGERYPPIPLNQTPTNNDQFSALYHGLWGPQGGLETLRIGENIRDFVNLPSNVDQEEWIAYHLHHLIDRVCVLFDLMKFFCNDGIFQINFEQPMAYALPVDANNITQADRNIINQQRTMCKGRIRIGSQHSFDYQSVPKNINEDTVNNWKATAPDIVADGGSTQGDGGGASTYISDILRELKDLRARSQVFPRERGQNMPVNFNLYSQFIVYHLINILSHYTSSHFHEIARLNIKMHVVTLGYNIFSLGERFNLLPEDMKISPDFITLNRCIKNFESNYYHNLGAAGAQGAQGAQAQ